MQSRIIEVVTEVEVFFEDVTENYGEDADGNRGVRVVERVPTSCQVLTRVPAYVEAYIKSCAIDVFNEKYNG